MEKPKKLLGNRKSSSSSVAEFSSSDPMATTTPSQVTLISNDGSLTTLDGFKCEISAQIKSLTDYHVSQRMRMHVRRMTNHLRERNGSDESAVDLTPDFEYSDDLATTTDDERTSLGTSHILLDAMNESTDYSEFPEHCDLESDNTRELLRHYLENSDSVDDLKIYKLEPSKYIRQIVRYAMDFLHLLMLVFTSKQFWNTCLMMANIFAAVFFYLVLAVSTIIVTVILNVHDALVPPERKSNENLLKKEMRLEVISKLPDIDELST